MGLLTRDQILNSDDLPRVKVRIPEWGDKDSFIYVRTMTASERDSFEAEHLKSATANCRARLAARTVCDQLGERIFIEADIQKLGGKSSRPLARIFDAAVKLNGISKSDVEELEKN